MFQKIFNIPAIDLEYPTTIAKFLDFQKDADGTENASAFSRVLLHVTNKTLPQNETPNLNI